MVGGEGWHGPCWAAVRAAGARSVPLLGAAPASRSAAPAPRRHLALRAAPSGRCAAGGALKRRQRRPDRVCPTAGVFPAPPRHAGAQRRPPLASPARGPALADGARLHVGGRCPRLLGGRRRLAEPGGVLGRGRRQPAAGTRCAGGKGARGAAGTGAAGSSPGAGGRWAGNRGRRDSRAWRAVSGKVSAGPRGAAGAPGGHLEVELEAGPCRVRSGRDLGTAL